MKNLLVFSLIAMLIVAAFAQEEQTTTTTTTDVIYNQGDISLDAGVDVVSKYFFRGLLIEDDGYIVQPYATINFHVISGCDVELTLFTGLWFSLHGEDVSNNAANDPEVVNEMDFYFGAVLNLYELLTVTTTYTVFTFPNDVNGLEDIHEVSVLVELNDGKLTGSKVTLNPFALYAYELHDSNPNNLNVNDESAFFIVGAKPSVAINLMPDVDMTISLPVSVGFGANNNAYVDAGNSGHTYGYTSVGIEVGVPLVFIPNRYGSWEFVTGFDTLFLSEAAEDTNGDDEIDFIVKAGIHMSY